MQTKQNTSTNPWAFWRPIYKYTWSYWQNASYKHFVNKVGEHKTVLDIGTGIGSYISILPKSNYYIFTDIDPISLAVAKQQAEKHLEDGTYHFDCCDAETAIKHHGDSDVISLIHVITVLKNPNAIYQKVQQALQPKTCLYLYVNRFSKYLPKFLECFTRKIGFGLMTPSYIGMTFKKEKVSFLNECYTIKWE